MHKEFTIGKKKVGLNHPCYIIAEIGNNHNGDFNRAIQLIDQAVEMGADCAKFQMRNMNSVYRKKTLEKKGDDLSAEYTIDLLNKFELTAEQHKRLSQYCQSKGIEYMCTPWDDQSVIRLTEIGVHAFKVGSPDLTNLLLISTLVKTGLPIILSAGMSTEEELKITVDFLAKNNAPFAMLHCNSTYPAPFQSINLKYLEKLKLIVPIAGYSGHERGIAVSIAAVALGAKVIERHFTLSRNMEGPDHGASLEFEDFKNLIVGIRQVESALGTGEKKLLSQGELINRENLGKSLISVRSMKKGTMIKREDIDVKSPGQGLSPQNMDKLIGTTLGRDIEAEDYFFQSDLNGGEVSTRQYNFKHPWGVPVRYHDFDKFNRLCKPNLFEFHLSYSDMNLKLEDYFKGTYNEDFVVHAPELFQGSRLMDLASDDEEYRRFSIRETQRVIDITRSLKKFFPKTKRPMIVANIGGFSRDGNIPESEKPAYYARFERSLQELDLEGVELLPQTMAPFPWHFGGQRFQNLYVLPDEIENICKKLNLRICLDVSHSKLTCNFFKIDFKAFCEKLAPYTAHLHLGDASGLDGEGLQVGDGEINFPELGEIFGRLAPNAWFIPEIWQGHKNDGGGFWTALQKLEGIF